MLEKNNKYDKHNMLDIIRDYYKQMDQNLIDSKTIKNSNKNYKNIIFCGMGGSSIGSAFIIDLIKDDMKIPAFINNSYAIPKWINKSSLVVLVSYSGNTAETISNYRIAIRNKANIFIISSGGFLLNEAKSKKHPYLLLKKGYPPRMAFTSITSALLLCLLKENIISNAFLIGLKDCRKLLYRLKKDYFNSKKNKAYDLASFLFGKNIIIYSTPKTKSLGYRFKSQLAENSKMLSYYHYLPELNHNDIEGYSNLNNSFDKYAIVWLVDKNEDSRIIEQMNLASKTLKIIKNQKIIVFNNATYMKRLYHMVYFLDIVSFHLAILNKTDPTPVHNINNIKS